MTLKQLGYRDIVGGLLGVAFISIGTQHFAQPEMFNAIVPKYLGRPSFWNYTTGMMEIFFGLGLMVPKTRVHSARLLIVLVLCMSLANINMWVNDIPFNGTRLSTVGHVIRGSIQILLLTVLLWLGEKTFSLKESKDDQ